MSRRTHVALVSLGCVKNVVDSEKMLGQLAEAGCLITDDAGDADAIVVNTCGFLAAARDEAVDAIREVVKLKRKGRCRRVVVAGCLVQRDGTALLEQVRGIDALVGVHNRDDVARAVLAGPAGGPGGVDTYLGDYHPFVNVDTARLRITPAHYAYLRISEGCDRTCTFCTIPSIRGAMHCKPPSVVLAEARELVSDGAVEINLIGQDTTAYGADLDYGPGLAGLLRELNRVDKVRWFRLLYAYPSGLTDAVIDAVADCTKVVKYVDLPLQHINDRILKAMARKVDRAATEDLLERIRRRIPGVCIRTTLIAGFPGETDDEFDELERFVRDFRFDALGVFPFSPEPDTPAGRMKGHVPDPVKQERVDRLMTVQQEVAFSLADARVGREFEVLIEGPPVDGLQPSRHAGQTPEVDSVTFVTDCRAGAGEFVTVRCTGRRGYDLLARPVDGKLPVA
ncbi:MAG: 30S ribosomal protein S12 methylthiotransferase RimO [Phycisphaerales bacterium]|nr:MAG: 30S ribosomal protein S12 methylthiotransferase RimO [Phycisphaerales bacterium]